MFFIPLDFGYGFVNQTEDVEFCYKGNNLYSKECDHSICFDAPSIGVNWRHYRSHSETEEYYQPHAG